MSDTPTDQTSAAALDHAEPEGDTASPTLATLANSTASDAGKAAFLALYAQVAQLLASVRTYRQGLRAAGHPGRELFVIVALGLDDGVRTQQTSAISADRDQAIRGLAKVAIECDIAPSRLLVEMLDRI